jgi:DNA-binding CsgD family transcriptional regulator
MDRFLDHHYANLVDLIYDAAVDQTHWDVFLDALPLAFDGAKGCLISWGAEAGPRTRPFGLDPDFSLSYDQHFGTVDPFRVAGVEHAPFGQTVRSIDVVPKDMLLKHEFYNDWMMPQSIPLDHFGCNLWHDAATAVVIAIAPDAELYGKQHEHYIRHFELLKPHLCRAVALNKQLARVSRVAGALGSSVDALGVAAIVLDRNRTMQYANALGTELLHAGQVLRTRQNGSLTTADPTRAAEFEAALTRSRIETTFSRATAVAMGAPVRLVSRLDGVAYLAWLLPLRESAEPAVGGALRLMDGLDRSGAVLVLVAPVDQPNKVPIGVLRGAFDLTIAEALLVEALLSGMTLAEYGASKGLARNTIRNQLTVVFQKTGTNRQADLVAHILAVLGPFAYARNGQ